MVKIIIKIFLTITFLGLFLYTILKVDYPLSLTTANPYQLTFFFIPFFLSLTFLFFFWFNILVAGSLSLGIIILLILKAFDSLNLVTLILTLLATYLLFSYFKNLKIFTKQKRLLPKEAKKSKLTHKL